MVRDGHTDMAALVATTQLEYPLRADQKGEKNAAKGTFCQLRGAVFDPHVAGIAYFGMEITGRGY